MKCNTPIGTGPNAPDDPTRSIAFDPEVTSTMTGGWTQAPAAKSDPVFAPGSLLGGRYQIVTLLGEGGMGAVYKALDRELDRIVALKVIRPQYAREPAVLMRFKRELVLARQVTHRNVIRIFDLGVSDGFRFITMEHVEGRDLSSILHERGKFTPHDAVGLVRQVCQGLQVAHAEGVIHRDLKPANVMVDAQGRAIIMDFGIARAEDAGTLTRTGTVVGTPVYMSPEQAKGNTVDARSDLYSLGVMFYELLTGTVPFLSDNLMSMLLKRCQEDPVPPVKLDPSIPPALNKIVLKALAREPGDRYQSARELLDDLDRFEAPEHRPPRPKVTPVEFVLIAFFCVALAAVIGYWKFSSSKTPSTQRPVTVLVADFDNTTSESVFEGTLEPVFMAGLEGAPFVSTYSRSAAHTLAEELKPGSAKLNEVLARLIAKREGINVVLTGLIARQGDGYRVTVNAIDGASGKTILTRDSPEAKKDDVVKEASKIVPRLRRALGDVTPEEQLVASGETFTSSSLDAVHDYGVAQQLQWEGKFEEAAAQYLAATKADPQFGRAYAGLAAISSNLGRPAEAEQYYKRAMPLLDRMTERERLRTLGGYFLVIRDHQKAIAESLALVRQFPYDTAGHANLALGYCYARDMANAAVEGRKAIELYPKNTLQRNNLAFYSLYAGETAAAIGEAHTVLSQNPKYAKAFLITALAQILDGQNEAATKTYEQLEGAGPSGPSFAAIGLADLAMYQGKFPDALAQLEKKTPTVKAGGQAAASMLLIQAEAQFALGRAPQAAQLAEKAVSLSESDVVLVIAARVLGQSHREDRARQLSDQLAKRVAPESGAWAKVIAAELQIAQGQIPAAIETLGEAQKFTDVWLAHFDLARAYVEAGAFPQASSELALCLKRRGEATSVFIADYFPTVRYLPAVYYYSGRAQEGLGSARAAESYKTFLTIKEKSQEDSLVADARRRYASLTAK